VLSFSPESPFLASTNDRQEVAVFDLATAEVVWLWRFPELLATSLGDLMWPFCPRAEPAWRNGTWELKFMEETPGWPGGHGAFFGPLGQSFAIVHNPSLSHTHVVVAHDEGLALNPGIWLTGGYVHVFGCPELELARSVETEPPEKLPLRGAVFEGLPRVTAFDYSPTGEFMATGSSDGMLALWRADSGASAGRVRAEFGPEHQRMVCALDYSPSGDQIATVGDNGVVRLWSAPRLALEAELPGHTGRGYWVEFAPDGLSLASSGREGMLYVWDLLRGQVVSAVDWTTEIGASPHFTYSASGDCIFFGSTRRTGMVGAFSPAVGRVMWIRPAGLADVTALAASPRRDLLAAGDRHGKVVVWPVAPSTAVVSLLPDDPPGAPGDPASALR
jgi:hypothetical protein